MKKFVILLTALCLVFGLVIGLKAMTQNNIPAEETQPPVDEIAPLEPEQSTGPEEAAEDESKAAFAALYALHEPDFVVASIDGRDVTWEDYYYFLHFQAQQMVNYFTQMANFYETEVGWKDEYEQGLSYEVFALENTESMLRELYGIEKYAAEQGSEIDADNEQELKAQRESDIVTVCGEGASEEDFVEALKLMYMSDELYTRLNACNLLYIDAFEQQYGANGELLEDAEAVKYLEDNGYLAANHILFLTSDMDSGEAMSEEAAAEQKEKAEKLAKELQAVEDIEARLAAFGEYKEEYDEDTGKTAYPGGYVFTEGTMVPEFEDTVKALGDYEVSEPVLSTYGYHVIMRLPHEAGRTVQYLSNGMPVDARYLCASTRYTNEVQSLINSLEIDYADDFEQIMLSDYVK